jgi:NAD(P)-dependent dehydrogenase (short-subunit alcohol dehydrogenase family)
VRALAREGVEVIAGARRSSPELDQLAGAGAVRIVEVDLSHPDGPADLIAQAQAPLQPGGTGRAVDILVNNVGSAPPRTGGFLSVTDELWQTTLELNLLAAVRACRAVLPAMLGVGRGAIVTISSVNATLADPAVIDYGVAKAGLSNFCKALAKEVGPGGVRVNTVSPGPVSTELWLGADGVAARIAAATGNDPAVIAAAAAQASVTGRFSTPEEVADAVCLLASDRAANITGADIRIDGGLVPTW